MMLCRQTLLYRFAVRAASCAALVLTVAGTHARGGSMKGKLTLARDGRPAATIVLGAKPTRAAQLGAFELQHHVKLITGATLPIAREPATVTGTRILVGDSSATRKLGRAGDTLKPQEYVIAYHPGALVLVGRDRDDRGEVRYDEKDWKRFETFPHLYDERGTLYAVYDFIERDCGVRWLNPTDTGTIHPTTKTLTVGGTNLRRQPTFLTRSAFANRAAEAYDGYVALWPRKTPQFKAYEAAAYADLHTRFPNGWHYIHAKRAHLSLFLHRMRAGGENCTCNHSLYRYYDRFWKKNPALPTIFKGRRADWFAQGYQGKPPQLCYTSPGLVRQVAQDAADYFDGKGLHPQRGIPLTDRKLAWGERFFAVEPMDNSSFCRCQRCQAWMPKEKGPRPGYSCGPHSNYFFQFVNAVAERVAKTHPNMHVVTLAYMTHALPPKRLTLSPNVAVQFCFANNRNVWCVREYQNDLNAYRAWVAESKKSGRPLYLWLYYTFPVEIANNGRFHCFPGFFAHTVDKQMKMFARDGLKGMFHCGYGQEVESYVGFKLMFDATLDVDKLLDEYFTGLYGAAAEPMKQFYLMVERTYSNPKNYPAEIAEGRLSSHQTVKFAWQYLGTAKRMAKLAGYVAEARRLAKTPLEKRQLDLFDKSVWTYMQAGRAQYTARMTAPIPGLTAPRVPAAGGDVAKVDWSRARSMGDKWYERGQAKPAARQFAGRVAHDGRFFYLELTDPCKTAKLNASPTVFCYDDWEIFIAAQRAQPYRQYAVGPTGMIVALSHGEVNWRQNVRMLEHGIKAASDTSSPDKWVMRLAIPLKGSIPGGVEPGGKLYMNAIRVTGPAISGQGGIGIDTWVSYCTVHEVDRLAEVTLAP